MPGDLGKRVVDHVFELMMIDEEWAVQDSSGFTWWGGKLAQRVWTDPPIRNNGYTIWRVHAQTDLLRGWRGVERGSEKLNALARYATVSALVIDRELRDTVRLASSLYVHEEVESDLREVASLIASIQAAEAHIMVEGVAEMVGAEPAVTPHPLRGWREHPDDTLDIIEGMVAPLGRAPSRWAGLEMEQAVRMLQEPPCILANGDETQLVAEYPFGDRTSLLRFDTQAEHPRLGNGCLVLLTLPGRAIGDMSARAVLELNAAELTDSTWSHLTGSWCQTDDGPTYVSFLPNALYRPGRLINAVLSAMLRIRWVSDERFGLDMARNYEAAVARKAAIMDALAERFGDAEPGRKWWHVWR